jgi:SAM-dependent methyltransferase
MNDIASLYRIRFSEKDRVRKDRVWKVLCEGFFQQYIPRASSVLEFACGYGEFIRHIYAAQKIAIDVNPESKDFLPEDVKFYPCSATNISMVPDSSMDVCFSSNFFEHLPDKSALDQVLSEALRVLKPAGLYIAMQPNLRYEPGRYWDYYDHVLPLTHLSCYEAFSKAGLEVIELIDRFVPFSTDSQLPQHPILVKIYLNCRPLWRLFGGQFIIVGRKPIPVFSPEVSELNASN